MKKKKKIVLTTGGTGGHLFPAQFLATYLKEKEKEMDILFLGGGLSRNRFFKNHLFSYQEVKVSRLKWNLLSTFFSLLRGLWKSWKILSRERPDYVIGFGSFYSFPPLAAAVLRKIPCILFEPNMVPGRVNRFFSKYACFCAAQFTPTIDLLKGTAREMNIGNMFKGKENREDARSYFYLEKDLFTFLVFGGSQGAKVINEAFIQAAMQMHQEGKKFQILHLTGSTESAQQIRDIYQSLGIKCCVKVFEENMEKAWSAADFVLCRSGGITVAEQIHFEVPACYIPFARAAENHQYKNAEFVASKKAAFVCTESALKEGKLLYYVNQAFVPHVIQELQEAVKKIKKERETHLSFPEMIEEILRKI